MCLSRSLLAFLLTLAIPLVASALATEHFGNAAIQPQQWGLPTDAGGVANLPSRVYWYEVNGSPSFYYRGTMADLNAALREFAKLAGDKHVRFVAGPGETKDLQQKQAIPFDWNIRLAGSLEQAVGGKQPTVMTVHINVLKPTEKPDESAVQKMITDLDSPTFATREAAEKKLKELKYAAVPFIQAAIKTTESVEARKRLEDVLGQLSKGMYLPLAELPTGVALVGPKDLFEQHNKGMKAATGEARGRAVLGLTAGRGSRAEVVKVLENFLGEETNEYALRCAASAATRLGADAKPLVPAMKKHIAAPDINVKNAFAAAVKTIEEAKAVAPSTDEDKRIGTLEAEIQQTLNELRDKKK